MLLDCPKGLNFADLYTFMNSQSSSVKHISENEKTENK